jgi:uncharacterized protein
LGEKLPARVAFSNIKCKKPLDNSAVHQAYTLLLKKWRLKLTVNDLIANKEETALIKQKLHYTRNRFIRIEDIIKNLKNQA